MLGDNEALSQSFFVFFEDSKTWQLAYRQGVLIPESPGASSAQWLACGPFSKNGVDGLYQIYHGGSSKGGCFSATIEMHAIALDPSLGKFPFED